jgi:hypothetical protein
LQTAVALEGATLLPGAIGVVAGVVGKVVVLEAGLAGVEVEDVVAGTVESVAGIAELLAAVDDDTVGNVELGMVEVVVVLAANVGLNANAPNATQITNTGFMLQSTVKITTRNKGLLVQM